MSLPVWPRHDLPRALEALATTADLGARPGPLAGPDRLWEQGPRAVADWIGAAADYLGVEAQTATAAHADARAMLRAAGPALFELPGGDGGMLAVLGARGRRHLRLLAPDLSVRAVPVDGVVRALLHPLEAGAFDDVDACLETAGVPAGGRARVRRALIAEHLAARQQLRCHMLRRPPGASLAAAFFTRAIAGKLGVQALAHGAALALAAIAWATIGRGVFSGHLEPGWLWGAIALLFSAIPFHLLEERCAWLLALDVGARLKEWLLVGVLRLEPEEIRTDGAGAHLARVIESESIQAAVLGGGAFSLTSALELGLAFYLLGAGAGGVLHALLLLAWCAGLAALLGIYARRMRTWTERRLAMTSANVERLVGHATRLVQEAPDEWHDGEDRELEPYVASSRRLDDAFRRVLVAGGRGWLLAGLLALVPAFAHARVSTAALAVGLGGVLLAQHALGDLAASVTALIEVLAARRTIAPLLRAAGRARPAGLPAFALPRRAKAAPGVLIDARDLAYRYQERAEPVLRGCDLRIQAGDRVLLEGPSGSGKSTLGALLAGLRQPSSGLLLLRGLDRGTVGEAGWRRSVAAVPQFHENHVFTGTLAYNLLLGGAWPPTADDLDQAETVCRELGLAPLIDRMPSGLQTIVGDTGWQLSHGERSRIFIARALLQRAELLVLDESFAALDPRTLEACLKAVLARAPSLVVIAHP